MTEKSEVVNTLKNNITKWFGKRMALTKSGKAGIMVKESTDKEGNMKHNIILMVSMLAFILVSGQTVQAKDYIKILKEIKAKNKAIKTIKYLIKDSSSKKNFFLRQIENVNRERRNELIKELLPFFKGKEAFDIIDEIEGDEQKESYDEVVDVLIEKTFNESGIKREKTLEKLRGIKEKILLKTECEQINFQRSEWDEGYEKWEKRDYVNAIPHFNAAIDENEAIIENPPADWPSGATWGNKYIIKFAYWIIGTCYMFMEDHDYVLARESFDKSINSYTEVMYATWTDLSYTYTGRTYQFENQHDTAISYFKKTSSYTGAGSEADAYWAESLVALGKEHYNEALEKINKVIADVDLENYEGSHLWPFGLEASYYNKAIIEIAYGNIEQARKDIEKGKVLLHYPGYTDDIGPMVKEYIKIYTKKFLEIEDSLLISISPNPLYISLGEKATIQAVINSANFKNPIFRSDAPAIFSVDATTVTGNIAAAEVTSLATGNGNIVFEVEIDGKIVSKKVEACVYEVKFFDRNKKEFFTVPVGLSKEDFKNKGVATFNNNSPNKATIFIDTNEMELLYSPDDSTPFNYTTLKKNAVSENLYENEQGYKVEILPIAIPAKKNITRDFYITQPYQNMRPIPLKITLDVYKEEETKKVYSNMAFESCTDAIEILPDSGLFNIKIIGLPKLAQNEYTFSIHTDCDDKDVTFKNVENELISPNLTILKKETEPLEMPENTVVLNYDSIPEITLQINRENFKFIPSKGAYIGVDYGTNPDSEFIGRVKDSISKLGYPPIVEQSITKDEILNDLKKCSILYITGHGIYDGNNTWSIKSLWSKLLFDHVYFEKLKNALTYWTITPKMFDIPENKYKFKVALIEACGSAHANLNELQQTLNADYYIGWKEPVNLLLYCKNFDPEFFNQCILSHTGEINSVLQAFKKAKKNLIDGELDEEKQKFIEENLIITPDKENGVYLDLHYKKP